MDIKYIVDTASKMYESGFVLVPEHNKHGQLQRRYLVQWGFVMQPIGGDRVVFHKEFNGKPKSVNVQITTEGMKEPYTFIEVLNDGFRLVSDYKKVKKSAKVKWVAYAVYYGDII